MLEEKIKKLEKIVEETSGVTMNISPRQEGWSCYFLQQKITLSSKNFEELVDEVTSHIENNREKIEKEAGKKAKSDKLYKYKK